MKTKQLLLREVSKLRSYYLNENTTYIKMEVDPALSYGCEVVCGTTSLLFTPDEKGMITIPITENMYIKE